MKHKRTAAAAAALLLTVSAAGVLPASHSYAAEAVFGDLSGDGKIDLTDAIGILKYYSRAMLDKNVTWESFGVTERAGVFPGAFGDVNNDSVIDINDAIAVLKYYSRSILDKNVTWESIGISPTGVPVQHDGVLTVYGWQAGSNGSHSELVKAFADAYGYTYGEDVVYKQIAPNGADNNAALGNAIRGGEDFDLFFSEENWDSGTQSLRGGCQPLFEIGITAQDTTEMYPYTLKVGTGADGALYGVSPMICPGVYAYRTDLAQTYLGVETPEEMQAQMENLDDFTKLAATLNAASDGKVRLMDSDGGISTMLFRSDLPTFVDRSGAQPKLLKPDAIDLLDRTMKLLDYGNYDVQQWEESWADAFHGDNMLGACASDWYVTSVLPDQAGETAGNWAICHGPTDYIWGGVWLFATKNADADLATQFLRYTCVDAAAMTQNGAECAFTPNNRKVVRSLAENPEMANPLLGGQNPYGIYDEVAMFYNRGDKYTPYDMDCASQLQITLFQARNGLLADQSVTELVENDYVKEMQQWHSELSE